MTHHPLIIAPPCTDPSIVAAAARFCPAREQPWHGQRGRCLACAALAAAIQAERDRCDTIRADLISRLTDAYAVAVEARDEDACGKQQAYTTALKLVEEAFHG